MVKPLPLLILALITLLSTSGCAKEGKPDLEVTGVTGKGTDSDSGAFCADFSLTSEQAQRYFDKAQRVSATEIHDHYDFLPCFVKGEARLNGQACEWEIRAGGTGQFTCGKESSLTACKDCLPPP